jgi:hypothetical protein
VVEPLPSTSLKNTSQLQSIGIIQRWNDTFETNQALRPSTGFSQSFDFDFANLERFSHDKGVEPSLFNQAPASKPFSLPELGDVLTAA